MEKIYHTNMNEEKAGMALLAYRLDFKAKKIPELKNEYSVMTKESAAKNMQRS